jgi:uncharacterized protein (TIGR02453 family)
MSKKNGYVTPRTFAFLKELARNNNREWFNKNKERYIEEVRDPLLGFVEAFAPKLEKISPYMVADPRPMGGSLFRIYRDTRFSNDKRPYKTHAGMSFRHAKGRDVHGPFFYLHLEPGRVFAAAGMWHPASESLKRVRDWIVARPDQWIRATRACPIDDGERLTRPPRGYDAEHPLVEDLKRKGFTTSRRFTQKEACAPDFLNQFAKACRQTEPLVEFLTSAVGLKW